MTRLTTIDPTTAQGETKTLLDGVNRALGTTPNLFRVAANSAAALNAMVQMNGALSKGLLRAPVREAIALAVAQANGCDYCLSAHTILGKHAGLSDEQIRSARDARSDNAKTDAILQFVDLVIHNRAHVGGSEIDALRAAGVSDGEIAEIMGNIAYNIYTNYLNIVADTTIDFPTVRATSIA